MSFTATITEKITIGTTTDEKSNVLTDSAQVLIDEAIPDASTDLLIALVMDVSKIAAVYIVSDKALTLEFNNATTGVPTIVLVPNVPYIWHTNSYHTNLLATDITALYATNASGATANLKIRFLYDSTV